MELITKKGLTQIMVLIKQLPHEKILILRNEIEKELSHSAPDNDDLTNLLLQGPIMGKLEFNNFKANQKDLSKWTKALFA